MLHFTQFIKNKILQRLESSYNVIAVIPSATIFILTVGRILNNSDYLERAYLKILNNEISRESCNLTF